MHLNRSYAESKFFIRGGFVRPLLPSGASLFLLIVKKKAMETACIMINRSVLILGILHCIWVLYYEFEKANCPCTVTPTVPASVAAGHFTSPTNDERHQQVPDANTHHFLHEQCFSYSRWCTLNFSQQFKQRQRQSRRSAFHLCVINGENIQPILTGFHCYCAADVKKSTATIIFCTASCWCNLFLLSWNEESTQARLQLPNFCPWYGF